MEIRTLDQNETDGLAYYRTWVNDVLTRGFGVDYQLQASESDIPYLDNVLSQGPYTDAAADELTILGSVMGDAIAGTLDMEWVVYTDEDASDFALVHKKKQVFAFPQDMLLRRAEQGTLGTVAEVYYSVVETLRSEIERAADRG
jgi:hypothetical protein